MMSTIVYLRATGFPKIRLLACADAAALLIAASVTTGA